MLNYILKKLKVTVFRSNINAEAPFALSVCMIIIIIIIIITVEVINYITVASKNIHLIRWLLSCS